MKKALIFLADGFEEIEALTAADLLRRANVQVDLCSVGGGERKEVTGSHGIRVVADMTLADLCDPSGYDAVITPGGMPGSANLRDCKAVVEIVSDFFDRPGKVIGSICAAPIVLGKAGIAQHISGTCYPGFEGEVGYGNYLRTPVVCDRGVVTAFGPAAAFPFALKLVEEIAGSEMSEALKEATRWNDLHAKSPHARSES